MMREITLDIVITYDANDDIYLIDTDDDVFPVISWANDEESIVTKVCEIVVSLSYKQYGYSKPFIRVVP